jgi:hypothetical protein
VQSTRYSLGKGGPASSSYFYGKDFIGMWSCDNKAKSDSIVGGGEERKRRQVHRKMTGKSTTMMFAPIGQLTSL